MKISTYIFKSPYPSAVQVGQPDPQAEASSSQEAAVNVLSSTDKKRSETSPAFLKQASSAGSVNVAVSSTDSVVRSSLETFSSLNSKSKAAEAFS